MRSAELPNQGEFQSSALTEPEMARDLADYLLAKRRADGTVPPSLGVTTPIDRDNISSLKDVFAANDNWTRAMRSRRGGFAMDTLTTAPEDTYKQRRFDFISELEGTRSRAYDDKTGLPVGAEKTTGNVTVGVGFNMDAEGNRDQFKSVLGLTDKDFDEVYAGRKRLSAEQVRRLFDATAVEAESIVAERFKDTDLTDHQRLALVSLAFNNPELIGPKLTDAVKAGKGDEALKEILFNSNRKNMRALAARRYREASMFAGVVEAKNTLPDYKTYLGNFA